MYNEIKKARFFATLKAARIIRHRSKADRETILLGIQYAFVAGWNACDNYRLRTGLIPTAQGVN